MKGEWCYFKGHVDRSTCERIIRDVQAVPTQDGLIGDNGGEVLRDSYRRSKVRFIHANDWRFSYIFDIFWKTVNSANDDFFQFNISRLPFLQFTEYDAQYQGEYKAHHDVFWLNNDPVYHRKISAVLQLSDPKDYVGGNFEMVDAVHKPPPEDIRMQGSLIYLPSFMVHAVTPVTQGKRYSLVAWFEGKKWQ